jgi:choice-of-anchor A domain-containing protein
MQHLSRGWKGLMAAGLMAWTAACGGAAAQEASPSDGQSASVKAGGSEPGQLPSGFAGSASQKMVQAMASANPLAPVVTETGFISLSVDGIGTNGTSGIVQANKPVAGATVRAAYLAAASTGFSNYQIPAGGVKIDGQNVNWTRSIPSGISSYNHWADVTSLVAAKINAAPAGRVSFTITETNTFSVDGEILAVVFNNPASPTVNTVILLFGSQSTTGDLFRIGLSEPINKSDPNLGLDLALGISFGYQANVTPERQVSLIDVNGQRLTSMAGGQDDGASEDGALITVGGLDDTNANPAPTSTGPGFRGDDELYDLRPFVANGATQISIFTQNPSNDDNIFFGALSLNSAVAVLGEGIVLAPASSTGNVGSTHTVTATLQDDNGQPLGNRTVSFLVKTGPNTGRTGTAVTNGQGHASYSYSGTGGAGRDEIQASFVKSNGQTATSNLAYRDWTIANRAPIMVCANRVLSAGLTCGASGSVNNGSSDPDGDAINCIQSPAGPYGLGSTTVTLTCTDARGLSASCTSVVQVNDTTGPAITCPANRTAECVNGGATVDTGSASASDNCGESSVTNPAASFYPLGVNPVTHTATDSSYNTSSCTQLVTVQDTQGPSMTLNGAANVVVECRSTLPRDFGATATDACEGNLPVTKAGTVDANAPGNYTVVYSAGDTSGHSASLTRSYTVVDTLAPSIWLNGPDAITLACESAWVDPGASAGDQCDLNLTDQITTSGGVDTTQSGNYAITYSVTDAAGHTSSVSLSVTVGPCDNGGGDTCEPLNLSDYNLFLTGDYSGGHDVVGKVAAGGNITMDNFAVGSGLSANDTSNTLVAGGNLTLSNGAVWGDASYGGSYSADQTVSYPRGSASQGTPIDFAARGAQLHALSNQLGALPSNGTTTRMSWGGIYLDGSDPVRNVVSVNASDFTGAALLDIHAPAGSLMVVNITGASASFTGFGTQFSGGIDQHGVLFNFTNTTTIDAQGFGFHGTVLAPNADITFNNGSWDGGIYAKSLTGNAEGHINPLGDHDICTPQENH